MPLSQVSIRFKGLPGLYPDIFEDRFYTDYRTVKIGIYEESFVTDEKYMMIDSLAYEPRRIQDIVYDKYRLKFVRKESEPYELMKYADEVVVFLGSYLIHNAIVLDVNITDVPDSAFQLVTMGYYDTNTVNYLDTQPIIDHLKSDNLLDRYSFGDLNIMSLHPGQGAAQIGWADPIYIYSLLEPLRSASEPDNVNDIDVAGVKKNTRVSVRTQWDMVFYLGNTAYAKAITYLPMCNLYTGSCRMAVGQKSIGSVDVPEFSAEKVSGAADLYRLNVSLHSSVINNLTYAVNQ